ncbi:hypothetical protein LINPERPRIM_LOCUS6106 [Linum perenne]
MTCLRRWNLEEPHQNRSKESIKSNQILPRFTLQFSAKTQEEIG